nr:hypothetical protein [Pseudomonas sp. GM21]
MVYWFCGSDRTDLGIADVGGSSVGISVVEFSASTDFHGDAGSGFLGVVMGVLALQTVWSKSELLLSWIILLGVFVVDATWTLARRLIRGDRVIRCIVLMPIKTPLSV